MILEILLADILWTTQRESDSYILETTRIFTYHVYKTDLLTVNFLFMPKSVVIAFPSGFVFFPIIPFGFEPFSNDN